VNIIIDIETIPSETMPPVDSVKVPANYKDASKILQYQKDNQIEAWKRQALDPMKGRIIAIGHVGEDGDPTVYCGDEADVMMQFNGFINRLHGAYRTAFTWCGWNCLSFDIDWLWKKACQYELTDLRRSIPKGNRQLVTDLMKVWAADFRDYTSLADCADFLGIQHDGGDGSEIFYLWQKGDLNAIQEHCARDLRTTQEIYRRICG